VGWARTLGFAIAASATAVASRLSLVSTYLVPISSARSRKRGSAPPGGLLAFGRVDQAAAEARTAHDLRTLASIDQAPSE
jgi:hypothetical protein